jgi:hypothetical protein
LFICRGWFDYVCGSLWVATVQPHLSPTNLFRDRSFASIADAWSAARPFSRIYRRRFCVATVQAYLSLLLGLRRGRSVASIDDDCVSPPFSRIYR